MPTTRLPAVALHYVFAALAISLIAAPTASAQRGGGGGSRGGGGASRGGGGVSAPQKTPAQRVKEELKDTDPVEFITDHSKQLELDKAQKDSFKTLHKEMQDEQKPIFKELERVYLDMERNGGGEGAGAPRGEGGRDASTSPARMLTARVMEVQTSYGEKASALLNEAQRHINDSLSTIYLAELRDKQAKARGRGRGRG